MNVCSSLVHFRDGTQLQSTFKQKITQADETCSLAITGVTTKMTGTYQCVAQNVAGRAESSAVVTVVGRN